MKYIVIECFGGAEYATVVTEENGNNKVFDNWKDAEEEAADCQEAKVIGL